MLSYGGGAIQEFPKIYITFWGWTSDPAGEQSYLTNFVNAVGGSPWLNTVTQYSGFSKGYITNWGNEFSGSWSDTSTVPTTPTTAQIAAEAVRSVSHFGYSADAAYIVALPSGHGDALFAEKGGPDCAWHSSTSSSYGTVAYIDLPYQPDANGSCGSGVQGASIVGGHEIAETQTDPSPYGGWDDSDSTGNFEIGDKCSWYNVTTVSFSNGSYAVQPLWSDANASSGTSASGCVLSYAASVPAQSCTTDSYGYCLAQASTSSTSGKCVNLDATQRWSYTHTVTENYLYHQGTFDGTYRDDYYYYPPDGSNPDPADCPDGTGWSPADPYVATKDPNLP